MWLMKRAGGTGAGGEGRREGLVEGQDKAA